MLPFILRRILLMIPTLAVISLASFAIIEAPPGDYMDAYVERLTAQMGAVDPSEIEALRERYGLDQPWYVRYWRWISGMIRIGNSSQQAQAQAQANGQRWARTRQAPLCANLHPATA